MSVERQTGLVKGSMLPGYENREVPLDWKTRPVPEEVFCYSRPDLWREKVWSLLDDVITDSVKSAFVECPPENVVSDDLSWLDEIIEEITGQWYEIKSLTATRLREQFSAFRMFHATRTNDLASFYEKGMSIPFNNEIEDRARTFFLNGAFSYSSEDTLQRAISELNDGPHAYRSDERLRLYCCADEADFTTREGRCGHYLDFGSEYLYNIGIRVVGTHNAQRVLRSVGSPTIFVLDVPMELVEHHTIEGFAGNVLEFLFCELRKDLVSHSLSPGAGSAVILRHPIPPTAIIGHFHPAKFFHSLR